MSNRNSPIYSLTLQHHPYRRPQYRNDSNTAFIRRSNVTPTKASSTCSTPSSSSRRIHLDICTLNYLVDKIDYLLNKTTNAMEETEKKSRLDRADLQTISSDLSFLIKDVQISSSSDAKEAEFNLSQDRASTLFQLKREVTDLMAAEEKKDK